MSYFHELGEALEAAWLRENRQEERFPEVADEVLRGLPPGDGFDRDAFIAHIFDRGRSATQQLAPAGAFGQPGVTMHYGNGFVIEVYYWLSSISAIHNHPFCGAFTVLEGYSVHARYDVSELTPAGGRAQTANITLAKLERIEAGEHRLFSLSRHPLVHALIHVPIPSISMVLRTVRTEGYLRYLPPSVVLPMDVPGEPLARQLAMLQSLGAARDPAYPEAMRGMLTSADFEKAIRILSPIWRGSDEPDMRSLLDVLRPRLGDGADTIARVLDRTFRMNEANALRERMRDPELRLVATSLMYAETRAQVLSLLPDGTESILRFIQAPEVFSPGEEASAVIAAALARGDGEDGAVRDLEAEYGKEATDAKRDEIRTYCQRSIFSPLKVEG